MEAFGGLATLQVIMDERTTSGAGETSGETSPAGPVRLKPVAAVWHTVILLVVVIGFSALEGVPSLSHATVTVNRLQTYAATLVYEVVLLGYVWLLGLMLRKVPLRELIGGRWANVKDFFLDVGIALLFWLAVAGMLVFAHFELGFSGVDAAKSMYPQTVIELVVFIVLAVFAGFCEEIIFRGYFQRQFTAWTGNVAAGVVLQAIVFGSAHMYQGWKGVLVITVYGAMFGALAALCKSLRPGIIQHCTQDGFSGFAVWYAQKHHILTMIMRF